MSLIRCDSSMLIEDRNLSIISIERILYLGVRIFVTVSNNCSFLDGHYLNYFFIYYAWLFHSSFTERVFAVPDTAPYRQTYPSLVWRKPRRMDYMSPFFPGAFAWGICLFILDIRMAKYAQAGVAAHYSSAASLFLLPVIPRRYGSRMAAVILYGVL